MAKCELFLIVVKKTCSLYFLSRSYSVSDGLITLQIRLYDRKISMSYMKITVINSTGFFKN